MKIATVLQALETWAPPAYQESYDNSGLLTGSTDWNCTGVICCLDVLEAVVDEAIAHNCNLIVAHHPIIFSGLKQITGKNYIERVVIKAIKNDIAIYAIHTNLDNVKNGVNYVVAAKLGLTNLRILDPKQNLLQKLYTFVPFAYAEIVKKALFTAGAGHIGAYEECSFSVEGEGTFKAKEGANPFVGDIGVRHSEPEVKMEVVFSAHMQKAIVKALIAAHPYEEVAYDVVPLANQYQQVGSGLIGELPEPIAEAAFFELLQNAFNLPLIKHTPLLNRTIKTVAVCGGAGSFLIKKAKAVGADCLVTADIKYHEFFDADNQLLIADIGHWESEQFTPDIINNFLQTKFPNFAVLKSKINTNSVQYWINK